MIPSDFSSWAWGADLTAANYSGGAGGTFTDLVTGNQDWTVAGATPSFATRNGLSGMTFSNSATQAVQAQNYAVRGLTVVSIFQVDNTSTNIVWGHTDPSSNQGSMFVNAYRLQLSSTAGASGYTTAYTSGRAVVGAITFDAQSSTLYASVFDGTMRNVSATVSLRPASYWQMAVGQDRTTYLTGWVGRVLGFHEPLHRTRPADLETLMRDEAAKVGL